MTSGIAQGDQIAKRLKPLGSAGCFAGTRRTAVRSWARFAIGRWGGKRTRRPVAFSLVALVTAWAALAAAQSSATPGAAVTSAPPSNTNVADDNASVPLATDATATEDASHQQSARGAATSTGSADADVVSMPLPTTNVTLPKRAEGDAVALAEVGRAPAADVKLSPSPETTGSAPSTWHFGGYGEMLLATTFYHPDLKVNDSSYRDTHLDLARVSLFIGTDISKRISFSSEIEFEHGGTGAAREIEWEEFGEYETEVEKGGEIVLEQAYLEGRPSDWLTLRGGHLLVPVGMTTLYHMPNLFSATHRPESEAQLLPSIWHENGVEATARVAELTLRGQIVTGLDSTGFSSNHWIAGGTQRAFERPLINDPATVLAIDYLGVPGAVIGASVYSSGSNRNRPKRDLYDRAGRVTIGDFHFRLQHGALKVRGLALLGHLQNAAAITRANASLSSDLGASRTAVASGAYAVWLELAYDVLPLLARTQHRLDIFARFDAYDSMWKAGADFDNPLLQRRTLTAGLNYFPHPRAVIKAEYVSRWLNENHDWARRQAEVNAALGFVL